MSPSHRKTWGVVFAICGLQLFGLGFSPWVFAASVHSELNQHNSDHHLKVATWNIRQASESKMQNSIDVQGQSKTIFDFMKRWFDDRDIDVLAVQEFQEKTDTKTDKTESPMQALLTNFPGNIKVLKGEPIREPTLRGHSSVWEDYCPIFYNSEKLNCYATNDGSFRIGDDYALGPQSELILSIVTPRYLNWAYCESKNENFDFVVSCVHINYKTAEPQIQGVPELIKKVLDEQIEVPHRLRSRNLDFIFAGDFNLDRRTAEIFDDWGTESLKIDPSLPEFPAQTRWNKKAFTKLKDIYTFTEAKARSTDIYDDIAHTETMNESLLTKYVDPMVEDYFTNPRNNRVDMRSLLRLSDHLPVISTYDLQTDSD